MNQDPLNKYSLSIFTEINVLASQHKALNLAQGFPNFEGPQELKEVLINEVKNGWNQYTPSFGLLELREKLAEHYLENDALSYNPDTEITITNGATEALFNSIRSLCEKGDEVIVFEPFYDAYIPNIELSGATAVPISLDLEKGRIPIDQLKAAISKKTRAILLNSPHNPSGIIFSEWELKQIAKLAIENNIFIISDEVYEHITFDSIQHQSIATIEGMQDRTILISSIGKSYSFTGWKVGWVLANPELSKRIRSCHQLSSYSSASALQKAAKAALSLSPNYYEELKLMYEKKRDFLSHGVESCSFKVIKPKGSYFFLADYSNLSDLSDREFVEFLIKKVKLALIPPSSFYINDYKGHFVRFCFSKTDDVLEDALNRLQKVVDYL